MKTIWAKKGILRPKLSQQKNNKVLERREIPDLVQMGMPLLTCCRGADPGTP